MEKIIRESIALLKVLQMNNDQIIGLNELIISLLLKNPQAFSRLHNAEVNVFANMFLEQNFYVPEKQPLLRQLLQVSN